MKHQHRDLTSVLHPSIELTAQNGSSRIKVGLSVSSLKRTFNTNATLNNHRRPKKQSSVNTNYQSALYTLLAADASTSSGALS
jgi:hypothetical protein